MTREQRLQLTMYERSLTNQELAELIAIGVVKAGKKEESK